MSLQASTGNPAVTEGLVLGAYALFAGLPDSQIADAYSAAGGLPEVGALEMPLADAVGEQPSLGPVSNGLPAAVLDRWDVIVTCIPTVMGRLALSPRYGLASIDDDGRAAAIADVRRALAVAVESAQACGRRRVRTVQLHSAPGGALGSTVALERSITELLGVEAAGAALVIEHCDAPRAGRAAEKGFLELENELAVLGSLDHDRAGLTVNWGRSAIEGRSAQTALEHIGAAAQTGRLMGLMFSGVAAAAGPWGGPWSDSHIPPRGAGGSADTYKESLLGMEEIAAATSAAGAVTYLGCKITPGVTSAALSDRVEIARHALRMIPRQLVTTDK